MASYRSVPPVGPTRVDLGELFVDRPSSLMSRQAHPRGKVSLHMGVANAPGATPGFQSRKKPSFSRQEYDLNS
jgi:hypothetical protein